MVSPELLERAKALHRTHPVVECHTDIPVDIHRRRRAGEASPLCDDYQARLRAGGVRFQFIAIGGDAPVTHDGLGKPHERALEMTGDVLEEVSRCPGLRIVASAADLDEVVAADQVGLILHLEGLRPLLGAGPSNAEAALRHLYGLGLRSAQLTWNGSNAFADGVGVAEAGGLTPLGREIVAELDRLGILIDVSHLAEPSFWDLTEVAAGPIVASHANAAAVHAHARNLRDDQIRAIAASGGYVGACFFPAFIGEEATLERVLDHVDHVAGLVGVDAVAVGPDYVDFARDLMLGGSSEGVDYDPELEFAEGLRRVETLPTFTAGLLGRGYSEKDTARIVGGNALRVLREVLLPA